MAIHKDDYSAQMGAWPYNDAPDHAPIHRSGEPQPQVSAEAIGSILDQMTRQIQARIVDVETRHEGALREMQSKFERMSVDAGKARSGVPTDLSAAFRRIEQGMADLAGRITDTTSDRRKKAENFVFGAPKPLATHFVFNPPAHTPVAPVKIEPANGQEPWDRDAADALARLYESGEAVLGRHLPEAALFAHDRQSAPALATVPSSKPTIHAETAATVTPAVAVAGLGDDRAWLDQRLDGLSDQLARSLVEARPDVALENLMTRVDQFEARFTTALDGLASKSDLATLKPESLQGLEAQIRELAGHIDQAQHQLTRLDAIEQHLSDLNAFAQASMEADAVPGDSSVPAAAPVDHDFAALADLAVERALARMPLPHANDEPTGDRIETQARLDAVHGLLQEFAAERRRGDQYTTGMLETVQEALIRLIDRVDAIDAAQSRVAVDAPHPSAAVAPQAGPAPSVPAAEVVAPMPSPATAAQAMPVTPDAKSPSATRVREIRKPVAASAGAEIATTAAAPAAPDTQPEISIKDLMLKAKRGAAAAAAAGAGATPEVLLAAREAEAEAAAGASAAKPQRAVRNGAAQPSAGGNGAAKRGVLVAAMALGLVGVAFFATKMWGEQLGGAVPASLPKASSPGADAKRDSAVKAGGAAAAPASGQAPVATTATGAGQPVTQPPGMVGAPLVGTPPPAAPGASGTPKTLILRDPALRSQAPNVQRSEPAEQDLTMHPSTPASVPETVSDDLSALEADGAMAVAEPAAENPIQTVSTTAAGGSSVRGMSIEPGTPRNQLPDPSNIQRQASQAAASERVGFMARPASDFSSRFATFGTGAVPPKPADGPSAAAITTGSNPPPRAEQPAAVDAVGGEAVPETAEMPPALIGPLSLRMAAAKGDPSASFEVATRFAEGRGIKQDFKQAMTWYQRAAKKGIAVAQYRLGTLYERGLGTPVDADRARQWYKRAAEQGNVKAMHNLAVLTAGNGQAAPDYATAAKFFRDAAERGLADSQFNLGVLNENGLGVPKDPVAAYVWFSLAARGGDAEATRRRDLLLATLDPAAQRKADEQVRAWRARSTDPKINDPRVAGDQWRQYATQADASGGPQGNPASEVTSPPAPVAQPHPVARTIKAPTTQR